MLKQEELADKYSNVCATQGSRLGTGVYVVGAGSKRQVTGQSRGMVSDQAGQAAAGESTKNDAVCYRSSGSVGKRGQVGTGVDDVVYLHQDVPRILESQSRGRDRRGVMLN